ncbi:MAG: hypothetical protein M2R45_05377 [Verrucomicrobia subdivision 3 bacterium]|nr:hypothetical protein [Limisphaerales bacterium]
MGAAESRVIGDDHIARLEGESFGDGSCAGAEGAKMHGNMGGVRNELSRFIKQGAGEVETILHVGRNRGSLELGSHLGNQVLEAMCKKLLLNHAVLRLRFGCFRTRMTFEDEGAVWVNDGFPTFIDKDRRVFILDDGGTYQLVMSLDFVAEKDRRRRRIGAAGRGEVFAGLRSLALVVKPLAI